MSKTNLRNDVEIIHETNSYNLKYEQEQNDDFIKHKRSECL